jgi:hypothetical protein
MRAAITIDLEPSAETAADELIVQLNLRSLQAKGSEFDHCAVRGLGADPDFAPAVVPMNRAVHRLHGGVCQERLVVERLDLRNRAHHRRFRVTALSCHCAAPVGGGFELRHQRRLLHRAVAAVVPLRLQSRHPLER